MLDDATEVEIELYRSAVGRIIHWIPGAAQGRGLGALDYVSTYKGVCGFERGASDATILGAFCWLDTSKRYVSCPACRRFLDAAK